MKMLQAIPSIAPPLVRYARYMFALLLLLKAEIERRGRIKLPHSLMARYQHINKINSPTTTAITNIYRTNIISTLPMTVIGFHRLKILDLAECGLVEWSQVQVFGALPALAEVVLDRNALTGVDAPTLDFPFSQVKRFSIASNK